MISLKSVSKFYLNSQLRTCALDTFDLEIGKGEFIVARGPSGSGKTTLLGLIAGMLRPTKGQITVNQRDLNEMNSEQKARFRAENIGFVFQMFHLVPYLNVIENVMLAETKQNPDRLKAEEILHSLGLVEKTRNLPAELSAGEKQRVAIARALINQPPIVLADEPTGNLDPDNARVVLSYLNKYQVNGGTLLIASHNNTADQFADRVIQLREGKMVSQA